MWARVLFIAYLFNKILSFTAFDYHKVEMAKKLFSKICIQKYTRNRNVYFCGFFNWNIFQLIISMNIYVFLVSKESIKVACTLNKYYIKTVKIL